MHIVIIGAGPAGLTAAYFLSRGGAKVTVVEKDDKYVGGISRTVMKDGFRFDIGGHRFFSKSEEVNHFWQDMLGDELITRPRKSRIYYDHKFYPYPLQAMPTLKNMGLWQAGLCMASYAKARLKPITPVVTFEDYIINHFGRRLYEMFFKTYTEKVWGMPCNQIAADWAAQRIKGLSLSSAIIDALGIKKIFKPKETIKTLITTFLYPRLGPGQMWEAVAQKVKEQGGKVKMGAEAVKITKLAHGYELQLVSGEKLITDHIISSMPIRGLIQSIENTIPENVLKAANGLQYRDFLTVALVVKEQHIFDDNWIYIHDPAVKVGRIQNFKSWSPDLVPDTSLNCYGLEYFCFEGDGLWNSSDSMLIEQASHELVKLDLAKAEDIQKGYVVRQQKAYPVYDQDYEKHVATLRNYLTKYMPNIHPIGRAGMHKYNNQDHAMMTAMLTAKNILEGTQYDVWQVNQDAEYHEEKSVSGERLVPKKV